MIIILVKYIRSYIKMSLCLTPFLMSLFDVIYSKLLSVMCQIDQSLSRPSK